MAAYVMFMCLDVCKAARLTVSVRYAFSEASI
jgi:hypothetical protein